MKNYFKWISVIGLAVGVLFIANYERTSLEASIDSGFNYAHYTMQVDSYTVTEISQVYGFRQVYIGEPTSSNIVYYKLDGSTTNIVAQGWWIDAGQASFMTTNQKVYLQLGAGVSAETFRVLEIKK